MNHKGHQEHKERSHPVLDPKIEQIVTEVIGAGLAVHRQLGPGFVESVYEHAIAFELRIRGLGFAQQSSIAVQYRGETVALRRLDLVVEHSVVVDVEAVKKLRPIHPAQLLSYLKASGYRVGLLMNFNVRLFVDGLQRFVR
jgi:GxxExxY protein